MGERLDHRQGVGNLGELLSHPIDGLVRHTRIDDPGTQIQQISHRVPLPLRVSAQLPTPLVPAEQAPSPRGNGSGTLGSTYDDVAADLIRGIRGRAGLTQAQLAARVGLARPALSAYENGRRQPSVATLARIAAACGAKIDLTPRIDPFRNGARFEDALSIVDAMPSAPRRGGLSKPEPWRT